MFASDRTSMILISTTPATIRIISISIMILFTESRLFVSQFILVFGLSYELSKLQVDIIDMLLRSRQYKLYSGGPAHCNENDIQTAYLLLV